MKLVRLLAGPYPKEPEEVSEELFISEVGESKISAEVSIPKSAEAIEWLKIGRIGSRFQVGKYLYFKVMNIPCDPVKEGYYHPPPPSSYSYAKRTWVHSCGCNGNCEECKDED